MSGPAANLMAAQGLEASIAGVARAYQDFLDILVVDDQDQEAAPVLRRSGLQVHCASTIMKTAEDKVRLAQTALSLVSVESAIRA